MSPRGEFHEGMHTQNKKEKKCEPQVMAKRTHRGTSEEEITGFDMVPGEHRVTLSTMYRTNYGRKGPAMYVDKGMCPSLQK